MPYRKIAFGSGSMESVKSPTKPGRTVSKQNISRRSVSKPRPSVSRQNSTRQSVSRQNVSRKSKRNKDVDTDDDDSYPYNPSKVPFTPRNQVTNPLFRNIKHINDVTIADIEDIHEFEKSTEHLNLTQKVLNSYFRKKLDCTQRIVKWLVDCEEKANASSLPAHLPNISYRNTSAHARHE
ncbi:uncharacterized protein LOC110456372 [Mizuhopecten yessoensis]|uniref:uncharacterized protein LOC110456372 n=1 Tax=Mizuhopecten yessoensis TaxID=6573 RepID=UPI000B45F018|nr:uncharacterized protein LOC110456372 [Mizuhopecten yessoensis]